MNTDETMVAVDDAEMERVCGGSLDWPSREPFRPPGLPGREFPMPGLPGPTWPEPRPGGPFTIQQ